MKWEVQSQHVNAASGGSKNKILKLKNVQLILKNSGEKRIPLGGKTSRITFSVSVFVIFNSFSGFLKMHQKDE
jgi:hypothetical protein